ncbi:hypothetical protein BH10ACT1_BH10ACT1_03810 [soil metagenome]
MTPTLIVLVPLLVVPVVALLAFTGCGRFGAAEPIGHTPPTGGLGIGGENGNGDTRPSYADTILGGGEGLVAYWTLSDQATTVAFDKGPSKIHGSYVGSPPPTQGQTGGALAPRQTSDVCTHFTGNGSTIQVDFSPLLNPAPNLRFTFEIWARLEDPASRAGDSETLASGRGETPDGDTGWELYVTYGNDGTPTFKARVFPGNGGDPTSATIAVPATGTPVDAWHLVALAYDGTGPTSVSVHVWVAGSTRSFDETKSPAPFRNTNDITQPLVIGAFGATDPQRPFQGDLDEAAFYNTALTGPQIAAHVAAALP